MFASRAARPLIALAFCCTVGFAPWGCDDKKDEGADAAANTPPEGSVAAGAEAKTAVGKQVEMGKERVEAAEDKLQVRDDAIMKAGEQDGRVQQRGMQP